MAPLHAGPPADEPGKSAETVGTGPVVVRLTGDRETVDELMEVERASFAVPWLRGSFESAFAHKSYDLFGIREDGELVAFAVIFTLYEDCDLQNIAVREDKRRRGFASALLSECIRCAGARGARRILLEVRESNMPARALYERFGFDFYGRRKRYYARPVEDALLALREI